MINTNKLRAAWISKGLRQEDISTNAALQECETGTIVTAALLGKSLNLSPSPQPGQYYLVPFYL